MRRLKTELHRFLDPVLARPSQRAAQTTLRALADGDYQVPFTVPYVSQFASPELINDYIHRGYDGTQDPNWQRFGADNPQDYAFWAPRVCALACLQMAIMAAVPQLPLPTLWELVQQGLALEGYRLHDDQGRWIDEGWYFQAQVRLAERYGLQMEGYSYQTPLAICQHIHQGRLVAATVSPELGERQPQSRRYGGHLVLVIGFRWAKGRPLAYQVHNPSGRYAELQAGAWIPAPRFHQHYVFRFSTLVKMIK